MLEQASESRYSILADTQDRKELAARVAKRILAMRRDGEEWKHFAERIDVSPSKLGNWRSEDARAGGGPDLVTFCAIMRKTGWNPAYFLLGEGRPEHPVSPDIAQRTLQDIEARIAQAREEQANLNAAPVDVTEDLTTAEGVEGREPPAPAKRPKPGRRASRDSA